MLVKQLLNFAGPIFETNDELESRPHVINRADFRVNDSRRKARFLNRVEREVCLDTRTLLRPGNPEHSILSKSRAQLVKPFNQLRTALNEDAYEVELFV